jgi:hypothetical protein
VIRIGGDRILTGLLWPRRGGRPSGPVMSGCVELAPGRLGSVVSWTWAPLNVWVWLRCPGCTVAGFAPVAPAAVVPGAVDRERVWLDEDGETGRC